jgi:UPF0042 nucleotide-binding protein
MTEPSRILLVTGMSGAGKTTVLKTFEDMAWETVDNFPLALLDRLLGAPTPPGTDDDHRPLAIGVDMRTRGFDADQIVARMARLRVERGGTAEILFLDCGGPELVRRFSETRRRHPLALDRPAVDGILRERDLLAPVRRAADHVVDTTELTTNGLQAEIRQRFGDPQETPTLTVLSFGFSRGIPRNADLVFDMRFLRNPHWDPALRPLTGRDAGVVDYVAADPAYADVLGRIEDLLLTLLPRYHAEGKSYVTVAFGCTGGRHRSVHVAERVGGRLRDAGFSPTVTHRDLGDDARDSSGGGPDSKRA